MKHTLLGTTALMAAGLVMGQAQAADPIHLEIGGFYLGAAGASFDLKGNQDNSGHDSKSRRTENFEQSIEIHFKGQTQLDNGITVGARIELEGQSASNNGGPAGRKPFDSTDANQDQIDKAYVFFKGGFGEAQFGDQAEALGQMCYVTPSASTQDGTYLFGADSPNFAFSNAGVHGFGPTNGTCYGLAAQGNSTEVAYFTPNLFNTGITLGFSFAPDDTEDSRGFMSGGFGRPTQNPNQHSNLWSVGAQFKNTFDSLGGLGVIAGGAISGGTNENTAGGHSDDTFEYDAYAQLSYAGFTLGGAWSLIHNPLSAGSTVDWEVYGLGLTYQYDAWIVGLGATNGIYEAPNNHTDQYLIVSLTGSYALGPGIYVDGAVEYYDYSGSAFAGTADGDYKAIGVGIGLGINF